MSKPNVNPAHPNMSRRSFLGLTLKGTALSGLGALGYAYWVEPHWIDIVHRPLPIAHLPNQLVGRRLVQISDLHVGESLDKSFISNALASIAHLQPDLLVITGDFMTCYDTEQISNVVDTLQHLPEVPLGTYAILGNHDYGRMWRKSFIAQELTQQVESTGIRMLRNEVVDVAGLQIAGFDDIWSGLSQPWRTLRQLQPSRAGLVLCHNPDGADFPIWKDYQGWILAGHTHGGQCRAPWLDPPYIPVQNLRYTSGEFLLSGNRRMYINRGLGYTTRLRFNCRPEITVFTLEQDQQNEPSALETV